MQYTSSKRSLTGGLFGCQVSELLSAQSKSGADLAECHTSRSPPPGAVAPGHVAEGAARWSRGRGGGGGGGGAKTRWQHTSSAGWLQFWVQMRGSHCPVASQKGATVPVTSHTAVPDGEKRVADVPRDATTTPTSTAPTPIALQALSPDPMRPHHKTSASRH